MSKIVCRRWQKYLLVVLLIVKLSGGLEWGHGLEFGKGVGVCVFYHDTVCFACVRFGAFVLFVWVFCSLWGMQRLSAGFLGSLMFLGSLFFVHCVCFDLCT